MLLCVGSRVVSFAEIWRLDMTRQGSWQHFTHDADIGVRGIGATLAESFAQAALALTAVMTDPSGIRAQQQVVLQCEAPDVELLLVEWLNALIYETAVRHLLFGHFEVQTDGRKLSATAWGERIDRERHQPAVEIKGATLTELKVAQEKDGRWIAQCVVDV